MIRLVRTAEGVAAYDESGRQNGRGAYICKCRACIEKAHLGRRADRALRCRVPEELYKELGEQYA